jgi:threonine aldolase
MGRLAEDHANAAALVAAIRAQAPGAVPNPGPTNIVVIQAADAPGVAAKAKAAGVLVSALNATTLRAVTHLDVTRDECVAAGEILGELLA